MTKPLSPAAQAVYDAVLELCPAPADEIAAAALRAAVDQVVPEYRRHYPTTLDEQYRKLSAFDVRNQFLAVVAELETINAV